VKVKTKASFILKGMILPLSLVGAAHEGEAAEGGKGKQNQGAGGGVMDHSLQKSPKSTGKEVKGIEPNI